MRYKHDIVLVTFVQSLEAASMRFFPCKAAVFPLLCCSPWKDASSAGGTSTEPTRNSSQWKPCPSNTFAFSPFYFISKINPWYITITHFFPFFSFLGFERQRDRDRERFSMCCFIAQMPVIARVAAEPSQEPGVQHGWQGPAYLSQVQISKKQKWDQT